MIPGSLPASNPQERSAKMILGPDSTIYPLRYLSEIKFNEGIP
jgi:hypothetical protein